MTSPDTTRTAYGNEIREEIARIIEPEAFAIVDAGRADPRGWALPLVVGARSTAKKILEGPIAQLQADLVAAREERDEAQEAHLAVCEALGIAATRLSYMDAKRIVDEAASLRIRLQEAERATEAWKRVAVIAAIPLEVMRMAGSYRALAPSTQTSVDEAVVTIRMAVMGHSLPPDGDIDTCLAPARAALAAPVPATEEAGAWPSGCIKPGSCSRHRQCVYAVSSAQCRHLGNDLTAEIKAAALKEREG